MTVASGKEGAKSIKSINLPIMRLITLRRRIDEV
jgi:hypothetical protein